MSNIEQRDLTWARRVTERLRMQATNYQDAREKVMATLQEARDGGAAGLLGYQSWTAYVSDVLGDAPLRLERDQRQELVVELSAQGLSTRAIAPIVGVAHKTVARDLEAPVSKDTGEPYEVRTSDGRDPVDAAPVTGLDGKTYGRAEPGKPRRRPITDQARDAGWELRRAMERLERIGEDARLPQNREAVAEHLRSHLTYVAESCAQLLDDLTRKEQETQP